MLKQYLALQQQRLLQMGQRQQQLSLQTQQEQRRLQLLTEHLGLLEAPPMMKSALGLQNLAAMKGVLSQMQQQQQEKASAASAELLQQQHVCQKQAAYSEGIATVLAKRDSIQQQRQQRQEQHQSDEIAMQLLQLQRRG